MISYIEILFKDARNPVRYPDRHLYKEGEWWGHTENGFYVLRTTKNDKMQVWKFFPAAEIREVTHYQEEK